MSSTPQLRRGALVLALLAVVPLSALEAQRLAPILDVGASTVRYADSVTLSATVVSPTLRIESTNATVSMSGTFSQIASGGWTTQGSVAGSTFVPLGGRFHGELAGSAGGSAHQDQTRTGQLLGQGRVHFMGRARGFWLGGGGGSAYDGLSMHGIALFDAGAWLSTGNGIILAALSPTSIINAAQPALQYTDATAATRWVNSRAEVVASLGTRLGNGLPTTAGSSTWGSASVAVWLAGPLALAGSVGSYPIDYTQGYPGGRFASVALRFARPPASKATSASSDTLLMTASRAAATPIGPVASFSVGPSADRRYRRIAVRARATRSVEVAGDFTRWQPVRLSRHRDGRWVATLPIPAGTHEIALRIDGGQWIAPPGLMTIRDEFGGVSGLLVIKE